MKTTTMDDGGSYIGWVMAGIVTIIGTLAAAITTLWSVSEAKNAKAIEILEKEVHECKMDRQSLLIKIGKMEERLAFLEHHQPPKDS